MDLTYEIVLFRVNPDTQRNELLEASAQVTEWLRNRPGYLGRETLVDENGQWIDIVRWSSRAEALAAAEDFPEAPGAATLMKVIEPGSATMIHASPAAISG